MDEPVDGGIDKAELGRRIRDARQQRGMTLKEMDQSAGLSATHISEIERGKTSPTIGALVRIARALGREVSFFVEPEVLPDIARSSSADRTPLPFGPAQAEVQTTGVPGGRLRALTLHLDPEGAPLLLAPADGSLGGFVLKGRVRVVTDGEAEELAEGDSFHLRLDGTSTFAAIAGPSTLFVISNVVVLPAGS